MHVLMVFMYHPVEKAGIWSGKGRLCYTIHLNSCSTRRSPDMPARPSPAAVVIYKWHKEITIRSEATKSSSLEEDLGGG